MSKIPNIPQNQLQELDRKLHEMALFNFELFCKTAGIDKQQAFVCFEFYKGKSLGQIAIQLNIGKTTVYAIAQKCPEQR